MRYIVYAVLFIALCSLLCLSYVWFGFLGVISVLVAFLFGNIYSQIANLLCAFLQERKYEIDSDNHDLLLNYELSNKNALLLRFLPPHLISKYVNYKVGVGYELAMESIELQKREAKKK